ncbi:MAG: hypothetical protein ABW321_13320 [Polyangiales bacterium]
MNALRRVHLRTACGLWLLCATGCLDRPLQPINPCLVSGVTKEIEIRNIDKVDLLFVVDNSTSMQDKQANLRQRVPQLVEALVTGKRRPDDPAPFPPVTDLHIAVVDSDMGLPGVSGVSGCTGFGHDGVFQHTPHPSPENPTCDAAYAPFLRYAANDPSSPSPAKIAQDFGCIANVGVEGCGYEQQLEASLKALWPSRDGRVEFLGPLGGMERLGHGDRENAGFLRDPAEGLSLLAIIVLSDEDDGSTDDMQLYAPPRALPADTWLEPSTIEDINLRALIGRNRDALYDTERYISAFKALRPGQEELVLFAAITGVPLDLVDDQATSQVDFEDPSQSAAYYDRILADPRMQHVPDNTPSPNKQTVPACQTTFGKGFPGRRYIEVAKGFGASSTVYSICEPDYTPALDRVIDAIAKKLRPVCLPQPLVRDAAGRVACDVVWELPTPEVRTTLDAPVACEERPAFLSAPGPEQPQQSARGGKLCTVAQIPAAGGQLAAGDGWYYDNFSEDTQQLCDSATPQRVAFTPVAKPPTGVTVKLICRNETQRVDNADARAVRDATGRVATIGSSCEVASTPTPTAAVDPDERCVVQSADGARDASMFCHPLTNTCVQSCSADRECPPAWVCDTRPATLLQTAGPKRPQGSAVCVNPTCGP